MLDSLRIKNFRLLEDFEVKKLGRVNLIVGKNNSGKSTVLEALRVYAGGAHLGLLAKIAEEHDEIFKSDKNEFLRPGEQLPFQAFFTGRKFPEDDGVKIEIGSINNPKETLNIEHVFIEETTEERADKDGGIGARRVLKNISKEENRDYSEIFQMLKINRGGKKLFTLKFDFSDFDLRQMGRRQDDFLFKPCSMVPTQFISVDELAQDWDNITLTPDEAVLHRAMRIVAPDFDSLAFVGSSNGKSRPWMGGVGVYRTKSERSAKVKLSSHPQPVPLGSLGDGMLRVLQLGLKLLAAKGGFLLVDEFENGLHYSIQEKIWQFVFEMAKELNVQVFATTHSRDCIESFSKVALAHADIEGVLFRMGRSARTSDRGRIIASVFDEEELHHITQVNLEVR